MRPSILSRLIAFVSFSIIAVCGVGESQAATVSGQVVIPAAPTGSTPTLANMSIRVEGTTLSASVDANTGAFSITDVPAGTITLMLVEESGKDTFTQASKRSALSVSGDVSNASFNLQYHWQQLAGYPTVWQTAGYDTWETQFVSDQVGFILFRISGSPERTELYRTINGGATWAEIGHWVKDDAQYSAGNQNYPSSDLRMFFADASHGVVLASHACLPCGCNAGFFRTANGGTSWTYVGLPLVETAYNVNADRFAKISATHWILAGWIGCHVQGYGSGFHSAVWETSDAAATWQVVHSFPEEIGCTGLAANSDGDAICFRTPYGGGPRKVSIRSGATGTWSTVDNGDLVLNSGYGPGDAVMIGDTAWVGSQGGSLPNGLYRSTQAGAAGTWNKISDSAVQYLSFGTTLKAFGLFGGPAYVSYDGGATWLYQSGGGGLCCHGNDIFAFDSVHAVWRDRGVGDPDGVSSIYTYDEPWTANFEVLPGVDIPNGFAQAGETNVPVASFALVNRGPVPIQVNSLTITASGTGSDAANVTSVKLYLDFESDGLVGPADTLLGAVTWSSDDGSAVLPTGGELELNPLVPVHVLVTYDLASGTTTGKTFTCSLPSANVVAETADTHESIGATAPAGNAIAGRTITTAQNVFSDAFEGGFGAWSATTEDPQPDAGYGWKLSTDLSASETHSAYIHEDRGHDGWAARHYLTMAAPVDLSGDGAYFLAFNEWYYLEPSPLLHVESSIDAGESWQTVRTFGNWEWNSSNGVYLQKVYDISELAGQSAVLLRFQLDWTSGWYFNATWSVDDVRIYRVPPAAPPTDDTTDPPGDPGVSDNSGDSGTTTEPPDGGDSGNSDGGAGTTDGSDSDPNAPGEDVLGENPEPPAPAWAPVCGLGMVEAGVVSMLVLFAVRRRR